MRLDNLSLILFMVQQQTLADYSSSLPESIKNDHRIAGSFAAVRLDDFSAGSIEATGIYSRKDFYKITLATGHASFYYRNKKHLIRPGECALVFTNRNDPYRWEVLTENCSGYSCMFTEGFLPLYSYRKSSEWMVFNDNGQAFFPLDQAQKEFFTGLFLKILSEQESFYRYKYELLFLYVLECIHAVLKLEPEVEIQGRNASGRLTDSFKTMLSSQFPLVAPTQQLQLRTAQDFADKLAIHTNHLNRALKKVTGKTTTKLITERIMQEANALLMYSNWTISQISYSLGFDEPTHFTKAFRRHIGQTPSAIRQTV